MAKGQPWRSWEGSPAAGAPGGVAVAAFAVTLAPGLVRPLRVEPRRLGAFSSPRCRSSTSTVPSQGMGRNVKIEFQERRSHRARGVPAGQHGGRRRPQRLGHQHPGVRLVQRNRACRWSCPSAASRASTATGTRPRPGNGGTLHLQVGDLPDPGVARLAGRQQGTPPDRQRRSWASRWADPRPWYSAAFHPQQFVYAGSVVGLPEPVGGSRPGRHRDERGTAASARRDVGSAR